MSARTNSLIANLVVGILALFALVCAAMLVPPLWTSIRESTQPGFASCKAIGTRLERQACEAR